MPLSQAAGSSSAVPLQSSSLELPATSNCSSSWVSVLAGLMLTVTPASEAVTDEDIVAKVGLYKSTVAETRDRYDEIASGWRDGKYPLEDRNLMIDGLLKRFLAQVDDWLPTGFQPCAVPTPTRRLPRRNAAARAPLPVWGPAIW